MSKRKETITKTTPTYNPSREELNDAISLFLKHEVRTENGDFPCDQCSHKHYDDAEFSRFCSLEPSVMTDDNKPVHQVST